MFVVQRRAKMKNMVSGMPAVGACKASMVVSYVYQLIGRHTERTTRRTVCVDTSMGEGTAR